MNVRYLPEAEQDIRAAVVWYEGQQHGLGERFYVALFCAESSVSTGPMLGREIEPGLRKWNLQRFPFALVYRMANNEVVIRAVMDLRREPGYWKQR